MTPRRSVGLGCAALIVTVATLAGAPAASADTVPYTDMAAHGSVGLCDANGRAVTHGNIHDKPFVWRAVSSTGAPAPYDGDGRKATLVAYQPRSDAYPNQWSGDIMTSSSSYTNPRYPMAQATALDFSLADFLGEFPARWDGYLQLRIYLGAPGQDTLNTSYPATDIKVTGDTWSVVRGASVPCTQGDAKDSETVRTAAVNPPSAGGPHSSAAGAAGTRQKSGTSSQRQTAAAPRPDAHAATARPAAADVPIASTRSGSGWSLVAVFAAAVAGLGGATVWWLRRRVN